MVAAIALLALSLHAEVSAIRRSFFFRGKKKPVRRLVQRSPISLASHGRKEDKARLHAGYLLFDR